MSSAFNPYLAFAAYLGAGLDGIRRGLDPGEPNRDNAYALGLEEMARRDVRLLPQSLTEALNELERDEVIRAALGPIASEFIRLKRAGVGGVSSSSDGLGSGAVFDIIVIRSETILVRATNKMASGGRKPPDASRKSGAYAPRSPKS